MSFNSLHNYDEIIRSNELFIVSCGELECLPSFEVFEQPCWGSTNLNMTKMSCQGVVCAMIQNIKTMSINVCYASEFVILWIVIMIVVRLMLNAVWI